MCISQGFHTCMSTSDGMDVWSTLKTRAVSLVVLINFLKILRGGGRTSWGLLSSMQINSEVCDDFASSLYATKSGCRSKGDRLYSHQLDLPKQTLSDTCSLTVDCVENIVASSVMIISAELKCHLTVIKIVVKCLFLCVALESMIQNSLPWTSRERLSFKRSS